QSIVPGEILRDAPSVLRKQPNVFIPWVKTLGVGLRIAAGDPQEKIRKVQPRLRSAKRERTIRRGVRVGVDLIQMEGCSEFPCVPPKDSCEIVRPLIRVAGLRQARNVHAKR